MIKIKNRAKKNITKQLKLDLKFFKSEVKNMEQLKSSLSSWVYRDKMTKTILDKIQNDKVNVSGGKKLVMDRLTKYYNNKLDKVLKEIEHVKSHDYNLCRWGQCSIDWVRNNTWGNCPKGYYRNGHAYSEYRSVTGCGYDKLSTLTANMFNNDIYLKSLLVNYIEKHNITSDNIESKLGYGIRLSSITGMPYFVGAVGVECHVRILKKLGFKVTHNETRKADFIEFERITK